jgi:hypothetical protein
MVNGKPDFRAFHFVIRDSNIDHGSKKWKLVDGLIFFKKQGKYVSGN